MAAAGCSTPLLLLLVAVVSCAVSCVRGGDLTAGFTAVELTEEQFVLQKPYDVPAAQRYKFVGGERQMWVYPTDKPLRPGAVGPRTEIRIDRMYSSGVWQFQGYGYVPAGTSGACVMQIHNEEGDASATTLMLDVFDATLRYYSGQAVEAGISGRWFRLNVIHDIAASSVDVYIDGVQRLAGGGHGGTSYYFKFGVYAQQRHVMSDCMESRWRNVTIYTKPDQY